MIQIEEIPVNKIEEFWPLHYHYLQEDGIIEDEEDKEYFKSSEYRETIRDHMQRDKDRHHLVYFVENKNQIGAASYCTYQSEDGKCFVLDYWLFPPYRNQGKGHECFQKLFEEVTLAGAVYFEINCDGREDRMHFWKSIGFQENGVDEYGVKLLIYRP